MPYNLINSIHILSLGMWSGAAFYVGFILTPSLKLLETNKRNAVYLLSLRNFFRFTYIVSSLAFASSMIILFYNYRHHSNWIFVVPTIFLFLAILVSFYLFMIPYKKMSRSIRPDIRLITQINLLNRLVMFLTSISLFLASVLNVFIQ